MSIRRRDFMSTLGLAAGTGAIAPAAVLAAASSKGVSADLLISGARIHTMDETLPAAQSVAIVGNRILAVGTDDELAGLRGRATTMLDGSGTVITPGFIDSHSHPDGSTEVTGADANRRSIAEIQLAMKAQAAKTPPGEWVVGYKYDDTKLSDGRPLNRLDLDEALPNRPAFVGHRGGHTAIVNSAGLATAGVTIDTPDPDGGQFGREDGQLTGFVAEDAMFVIQQAGNWPRITREVRQAGVAYMSRAMAAAGMTSTTDAWGSKEGFTAFQDARAAGELLTRLSFMPFAGDPMYQGLKDAGIRSGFGDEWIRIGAVKHVADGSASERTMRMSTPFEGRPDFFGILTMSQQEIHDAVADAVRHGFRIGIHANGDVTIDMVLNAYEDALRDWPGPNPRFRIEHCSLINADLLRRIKATGSIPTPFYTYAHFHGNKWPDYGPEKMRSMFAHRSFLDHGIPVAPASDYTPGPFEPLMAIQSMVTRKDFDGRVWGPNQRISVAEAMKICTMNGAYASMEENIKGSITPGKLADLVMLAADPHEVDPDSIKHIKVLRTIVDGEAVYEGTGCELCAAVTAPAPAQCSHVVST